MERPEETALMWIALALVIFALCLQVWFYVSARRSGKRQPIAANSVLSSLGAVVLISGSLVGELAGIIMAMFGCSLLAFAAGRMSTTMKLSVTTDVRPRISCPTARATK